MNNASAIGTVKSLLDLTSSDAYAARLLNECKLSDRVSELGRAVQASQETSDDLRVALVGKLKAGKSTLVNAVVGKTVAYTDFFVASTHPLTVKHGPTEAVCIASAQGAKKSMTRKEYLAACERKQIDPSDRATFIVETPLPFILIDTPGLDAMEDGHNEAALATMMEADLSLYAMDINSLMDNVDIQVMAAAQERGLPIWCVLTKTDETSDATIETLRQAVIEKFGFPPEHVIAVSAHRHLKDKNDPGLQELINNVRSEVQNKLSVKGQAIEGKTREILRDALDITGTLLLQSGKDMEWIRREGDLLREQGESMKGLFRTELRHRIADSLSSYLRRRVPELIGSGTSQDRLNALVLQGYREERLPSEIKGMVEYARQQVEQKWNAHFDARTEDLESQISRMAAENVVDESSVRFLQEEIHLTGQRKKALHWGWSVAGGALSVLLLDPTGIVGNAIVMGLGAGLPHLIDAMAGREADSGEARQFVLSSNFDSVASDFSSNIAQAVTSGEGGRLLDQYVDAVVSEALDERCSDHFGMRRANVEQGRQGLLSIQSCFNSAG